MSPEPSRSHSRDKAESNGGGRLSRKARREQRVAAKRSGGSDTPVANGSSTARKQVLETGKDPRPKSPNGTTPKNAQNDKFATFEEGEDFVAFTISDSDDEAGPSNRDQKQKQKESKVDVEQDDEVQLVVTDTRIGDTRVDKVKSERAKEKSKMQDPPSALRTSEREWDRNKVEETDRGRNGRHKRKHGDDYDRDDGYANKKQRMDAASRKCPWVRGLDLQRCQNVAEMLHKEVEAFVHWISPSPVEDEIRGLIVTQITKVVTASFPDAVVSPFGSYQTKLYLPLGDIDLVVLSDAMAYSDKSTVLHLLANTLKRAGITSHVTIIAKAKVPIVKFITTHGRFKVDISINQGNGLVSGQIISGFLKNLVPTVNGNESKALRSLVMITKAFLSQRSMNEVYTGGLGSYSIVCLAVSFLQMHPKIRRAEIDPEKNLGVLMMEFFELYGQHFNYDEVGISLRDGGTYFSKRQRGWHTDYKRNMLSIEDPADPSNDISSGSYNFHKVRTAFAGCHGILTSTAYLRAGILSSRHHGRSVNLRGHYESEDLSILSTVMGITQETINHRRLVKELYDREVLHNIVGVKPLPTYVHSDDEDDGRRVGTTPVPIYVHSDDEDNRTEERRGSSSKTKASRDAVESAWDRSRDADDDYYDERSSRDRRRHRNSVADEERGRYDIGRQPPKKRRRTGRADETVYFVDDDDDEDHVQRKYDEEEEEAYMSDEVDSRRDRDRSRRSRSRESRKGDRRDYWLSKAIGIGGSLDDSS